MLSTCQTQCHERQASAARPRRHDDALQSFYGKATNGQNSSWNFVTFVTRPKKSLLEQEFREETHKDTVCTARTGQEVPTILTGLRKAGENRGKPGHKGQSGHFLCTKKRGPCLTPDGRAEFTRVATDAR